MTTLIAPVQELIAATFLVLALVYIVSFIADQFGGLGEAWLREWRKRDDDIS